MAIKWPGLDDSSKLPNDFQQDGYNEGNIDNLIQTTMNNGPSKRRRRTTHAYQSISGTMILTNVQRATFIAFYKNNLKFGALPCLIRKPGTVSETLQCYIESQSISPLSGTQWSLSLSILVLV